MKDKSKKHDHKGTKILKLSIFASVMLAPLFAIAFKCAYATFNKNAYQSYSSKSVYQNVNIDQYQNVNIGTKYTLTEKEFNTNGSQFNINFDYISLTPTDLGVDQATYDTINGFLINQNWQEIRFTNSSAPTTPIVRYAWEKGFSFDIIFSSTNNSVQYINTWFFVNQITYNTDTLDNAFYYAVDQMKDNELFAWTKNTALYTPINAMTSGLGITTDAIAVLLAYWLYITLIYVIFDIVIELFTYLSHLIMGNPIG